MNIAVDLDDSIGDLLDQLLLFHNEVYGTCLERDHFLSYHYEEVWGGTRQEAVMKVREFIKSQYFNNITPIAGALETLLFLKQEGHKLYIITGREDRTKEITLAWLKKYFPGVFSGVYHTNAYTKQKRKKSELCQELEAFVIIDDDIMHIIDCIQAGINVIVLDNPWNRVGCPDNAIRVHSWTQIPQIVNRLQRL